jgi:predicted O-methyltransferase YrrM
MVEIRRADFLEETFDTKFSLVFCDATHSVKEIDRNLPKLLDLLAPGGILACDDIRDEQLQDAIYRHSHFAWSHLDKLLFYGEPDGPPSAQRLPR